MATKLLDKVKIQEEQESKQKSTNIQNDNNIGTRKHNALNKISSKDGKDKQISAKVNSNVYALFTEINKAQGISNNSALNMILTKYVRENKAILDEL